MCVKLEEFKEGDSVDLLFSSPETLEKHYEVVSNVSENIFGVVIDETHCVVTWWVKFLFSASYKSRVILIFTSHIFTGSLLLSYMQEHAEE